MRPRSLTPEQETAIAQRYSNEGAPALSREFDVTVQTICNVLRRAGITPKTKTIPSDTRTNLPDKGNVTQTAHDFGISASSVVRIRGEHREVKKQAQRERRRQTVPRAPRAPLIPTGSGIIAVSIHTVDEMCEKYHVYKGAGRCATYCFAVIEDGRPVAAYAWQPPTLGTAKSVCPEAPAGVLALSRMVAVPKAERQLRHISKPLRKQMQSLIDRTRWPVLVTYNDEGQGHTGHVYKCSGWQKTMRAERPFYVDNEGRRCSIPTSKKQESHIHQGGVTTLQRWEQWACERGGAALWMAAHGWKREEIPGRTWRSGNPAFTWIRR